MIKTAIPVVGVWALVTYIEPLNNFIIQGNTNKYWDFVQFYILLAPLGTVIGHCWPMFSSFKGGKAVSAMCGFAITTCWGLIVAGITTFYATLKAKKYVSLASILTAIIGIIFVWVFAILKYTVSLPSEIGFDILMWGNGNFIKIGFEYATIFSLIAIILILRHISNIKRLVDGNERKITWLK